MSKKPETVFSNELKLSIMHYANDKGFPPPVVLNIHGSVYMANVPDLFIAINGVSLFAELKVRPKEPTRSFKLDAGVDPGQRLMMRALAINGMNTFLIVRISRVLAIASKINSQREFAYMKIDPQARLQSWFYEIHRVKKLWEVSKIIDPLINAKGT